MKMLRAAARAYLATRRLFRGRVPEWTIRRVFVICEDRPTPDCDFVDATGEFDPTDVEACVPAEWKAWRIEVRYAHRDRTFRAVIRPGEPFEFPPVHPGKDHHMRLPTGAIFNAFLYTLDASACIDVTSRLRKYHGVGSDFGKRALRCHDLFPFDDAEYMAERFGKLVVVRLDGTRGIRMAHYDFASNERIAF